MKFYLASRYSRFKEMQDHRKDLGTRGHSVTSRWIDGNHQIDDAGLSLQAKEQERVRFAAEDMADLLRAETVISFTEAPRSTNSRGGRHVEFGVALGRGKFVIVVGHRENVFHCLPQVRFFSVWEEFLAYLPQWIKAGETS